MQQIMATFFPCAWTVRVCVVHKIQTEYCRHEETLTVFAPNQQEAARAVFAYKETLWRDLVAVDVISVVELKRPDQVGGVGC